MGRGLELLHARALVLHLLRLRSLSVDRLVDRHVVLALNMKVNLLFFIILSCVSSNESRLIRERWNKETKLTSGTS